MNWDNKAYEHAEARNWEYFGHLPEQMFEHGAKWQREQLRTNEAIERVARAVWEESYTREKDRFEDERKSTRGYCKVRAERLITALLGDN